MIIVLLLKHLVSPSNMPWAKVKIVYCLILCVYNQLGFVPYLKHLHLVSMIISQS